ncbi:PHD-finger [Trichostrongylus colubriformis]|uniref:PHD-finger n=1 Tax=Trichostrongylus colubriformis TaxID=6319 RepID=A0AAN8IUI6_TRICO
MKFENRRSIQSLCQGMESCEEEDDHSPRRGHSYHRLDSNVGTPTTSSRCLGDSHIEVSDEDRDIGSTGRENTKKTGVFGSKGRREVKRDERYMKEDCIDSILDDRYPFLDGTNRRNYYIIRSDGRLAEVFRTDLFDRLRKGIGAGEESDDDDVPGSGLARMTDRWRAEWSNGIQIPLRTTNPNPAEVRKAVVKPMSPKLSRVSRKRRELIQDFFANAYEPVRTAPLRLYECTILDELWVKLFNEQRAHTKTPLLHMEVFLEIMNEFEIECYKNIHRKLLEPLHSPSSRIEDGDDEAACDICLAVDSEPDDEMVFCDGCNLCVHMSCYGLQELPPDEWLCMKCLLCYGRNPPCVLCPTIGGALKCTDTNQWAHVVCALWIPECRFGDFEKREPITRIHEIKEERWSAKCSICDTRQGACIKCSVDSCMSSFHSTCALRSGLEMRIEQDPIDDRIHMISLCPKHRFAKPFRKDEKLCESSQTASDDETAGICGSSPLEKLEQACYEFVDYAAIATKMKLDPSVVADVFAYWVKKRLLLNKGKPLIENLQDEIKVVEPDPPQLELPVYTESKPVEVKRKRGRPRKNPVDEAVTPSASEVKVLDSEALCAKERLQRSLSGGKRLFDLVLRKCKEQRNYLNAHMGGLLLITEHLSKPVPLSHRTDRYLNEVLQTFCLREVIEEGEKRADEICGLNELIVPKASPSSRRDDVSSIESTPASTSSSESYHPPCLRNNSSVTQGLHAENQQITPSKRVPRRSLSSPRKCLRKRRKPPLTTSKDFEEQRHNRRRTLRSSDLKTFEKAYLPRTHDLDGGCAAADPSNTSFHGRDTHQNVKAAELVLSDASMINKREEDANVAVIPEASAHMKQSSSKGRSKSRAQRKSDTTVALDGSKSPSPKRQRNAQATGRKCILVSHRFAEQLIIDGTSSERKHVALGMIARSNSNSG